MKTALCLGLALALVGSAHAQVLRPRSGERGGRDHGSHDSSRWQRGGDRDHSWRGGSSQSGHWRHHSGHGSHDGHRSHFGHSSHRHHSPHYRGSYVRWHVPFHYDYPSYGYYPSYRTYPSYGYYGGYGADYRYYGSVGYDGYWSASRATNGLLLGALAGGIIGNNSGTFRHDAWRGAAWGAGVGWLLGAIADSNRRVVAPAQPYAVSPPVAAVQVQQPAAQQVTVINNYYHASTPMSGANALFGRN